MPGYGHKNPQAMCSSWIYYVFLTAKTSLTFRFLPALPPPPNLEKVYVAIAFAAVMKPTLARELCPAQEAGYSQLSVPSLGASLCSSNCWWETLTS